MLNTKVSWLSSYIETLTYCLDNVGVLKHHRAGHVWEVQFLQKLRVIVQLAIHFRVSRTQTLSWHSVQRNT